MKVQLLGDTVKISFRHARGVWNYTYCSIRTSTGELIDEGAAKCVPSDNFSKALGRKKSLTRAIKYWPKETRRKVWTQYFLDHKDRARSAKT